MSEDIKNKVARFQATQNVNNSVTTQVAANKLGSTFANVRENKNTPVQVLMNKELPALIGSYYVLVSAEYQETTDNDSGDVHTATVYVVKTISKKSKAKVGTLLTIKVKDSKPIISDNELNSIMLGEAKPIVVRFKDIAHYAYIGGESLNATKAEKVNISPIEASKL